jgi:hypothetical protein
MSWIFYLDLGLCRGGSTHLISTTATFTVISAPSSLHELRLCDLQTLVIYESQIAAGPEDHVIPTACQCLCPRKTTSTAPTDRRVWTCCVLWRVWGPTVGWVSRPCLCPRHSIAKYACVSTLVIGCLCACQLPRHSIAKYACVSTLVIGCRFWYREFLS